MSKQDRQNELARCEQEIEEMLHLVMYSDERWMLGYLDWKRERGIIMEQFVDDAIRTEPTSYGAAMERLQNLKTIRLLHVGMGLVTEAAEIMDQLKRHIIYGKPLDDARLVSDLGDGSWYERIGCRVLEVTLAEMIERNVRELKARYPEKFTEERALVRDEAAEMDAALLRGLGVPSGRAEDVKVVGGAEGKKVFDKFASGGIAEDKGPKLVGE